jgi:rod shape determining protein RodA
MIQFDRRLLRNFDLTSFALVIVLGLLGIAFVFSATYKPEDPYSLFFKKQALGFAIGIVVYILFCLIDHRTLMRICFFSYLAMIPLLVFTILKGSISMGGQRWVSLGFFKFQPSEPTKLLFTAFCAYYFYAYKDLTNPTKKNFWPILIILGISFILILKQPDLGTALVLAFSGVTMLWFAGMPRSYLIYGACAAFILAPIGWHVLKEYQKQRIAVFLGYGDVRKERYQIEQARIAIGSGGIIGKGFLKGTQNKLLFLPESRTDFIFAVICEEVGFLGTLLIIALYVALFFRMILLIMTLTSPYDQLLALGIISPVIISAIINMFMVLGLLPIVGIPLPLMSYGLSNLLVTFASLGWFNGIIMRRGISR